MHEAELLSYLSTRNARSVMETAQPGSELNHGDIIETFFPPDVLSCNCIRAYPLCQTCQTREGRTVAWTKTTVTLDVRRYRGLEARGCGGVGKANSHVQGISECVDIFSAESYQPHRRSGDR